MQHAPKNYQCPLCLAVKGIENEQTMMKQSDIVYKDDLVFAAINSKFYVSNPGHVIIAPLKHFENIYDLSTKASHRIMDISQKIAIALKIIRKCDGIMILQNNEPASGQHAFHYHLHVIPRFYKDNFQNNPENVKVSQFQERSQYSTPLKKLLH